MLYYRRMPNRKHGVICRADIPKAREYLESSIEASKTSQEDLGLDAAFSELADVIRKLLDGGASVRQVVVYLREAGLDRGARTIEPALRTWMKRSRVDHRVKARSKGRSRAITAAKKDPSSDEMEGKAKASDERAWSPSVEPTVGNESSIKANRIRNGSSAAFDRGAV